MTLTAASSTQFSFACSAMRALAAALMLSAVGSSFVAGYRVGHAIGFAEGWQEFPDDTQRSMQLKRSGAASEINVEPDRQAKNHNC